MSRRDFTDQFKADAVQLVVSQGYSFAKACEAMGVGDTALRRWVAQWRAQQAEPPRGEMQVMADQRRIRELEARVRELEREREILKKSTAFFVKEMDRSSK
jgi:transposase